MALQRQRTRMHWQPKVVLPFTSTGALQSGRVLNTYEKARRAVAMPDRLDGDGVLKGHAAARVGGKDMLRGPGA